MNRSTELQIGHYDGVSDKDREKGDKPDLIATQEIERFLSTLPKGSNILEAGAGRGLETVVIENAGMSVFPLDMSEKMLYANRLHILENNWDSPTFTQETQADIFVLPYKDEAFDAVVCKDVLSLGSDHERKQALGEFARVVKPGGKVLVLFEEIPTTIAKIDGKNKVVSIEELLARLENNQPYILQRLEATEKDIVEALRETGFNIKNSKTLDKPDKRWINDKLVLAIGEKPIN